MALDSIVRDDAAALIPEEVAREIIQELPAQSVVLNMPQVNRRTMSRKQLRMPILSMIPQAYWVTETGTKQQTKSDWANKFITAEELAVIVAVHENVLDDVDYDLWAEIRPQLVAAIGAKLDQAVLFGVDAPASFENSISESCDSTDNEVKNGTGVDLAADINSAFGKVEEDGFAVNGAAARVGLKASLRGLRDDNNQPIFSSSLRDDGRVDSIYGENLIFPMNGGWEASDADMIVGDWSQLFLGVRSDISFKVSTDATVGGVSLFETDQVALRVTFRAGFVVANPKTRENPSDATRYPFACVRPTGWVGTAGSIS